MKTYSFEEIKENLTRLAIEDKLPLDLTMLEEDQLFPSEDDGELQEVRNLGCYISDDDVKDAYNKLLAQAEIDGSVDADEIVTMWEPLESKNLTVDELLEMI